MPKPPAQSSSAATSRPPRRKWTRQELLEKLQILSSITDPLPATLPPSPPASRSTSPLPALKRKADGKHFQEPSKRPRTSSLSNRSHLVPPRPSSPLAASSAPNHNVRSSGSNSILSKRAEPREDGEVCEDPIPPPAPQRLPFASTSLATLPLQRPKRGNVDLRYYDELHDKYYAMGRKLKYSGDVRFASTYSPTNKDYRPLPDPPPANSLYHKHGGVIAKIELLNALICFTYALWCKDFKSRSCNRENWNTIGGLLSWCKVRWQDVDNEKEKALLGLICMIESYISTRKVALGVKLAFHNELNGVVTTAQQQIAAAIAAYKPTDATPQMLPSPASIGPASSANSTPTNRDSGTPSVNGDSLLQPTAATRVMDPGPPIPSFLIPPKYSQSRQPVPSYISAAANSVTISVSPQVLGSARGIVRDIQAASHATTISLNNLTLPIMSRSFPRTFARILGSTLGANEEHEPDIEDDDGELFWPTQNANGTGLGWICLMGQAMTREFGQPYGYRGLAGVVPKPEADDGVTPPPMPSHHALPPRPARPLTGAAR